MKLYLLFFLIIFQNGFSQNSKAKDLLEKANKASAERKFEDALSFTQKALEKDSTLAEAHFKAGQLFEMKQNQAQAMYHFKKSIALKPNEEAFNQAFIYVGSRSLKSGDYATAKEYLEKIIKKSNAATPIYKQLKRQLDNCDFAIEAIQKPIKIAPKAVAGLENFAAYSYFPVLTADAKTMIFTARSEQNDENLFISQQVNGQWQTPKSISKNINTPANEGTCSVSADGRTLVFTSCDGPASLGSCDLYLSKKTGEDWSKPANLGRMINSSAWESQPSLSADGRILYFVSERSGGFGKKDIMVSYFEENNQWSPAKNLGKTINTPYDDVSPFIHANGHTLFFASDGQIGLGGFDLYFSEIEENKTANFLSQSNWSKPENLGFPINTFADQIALFITTDGKQAYYSFDDKKQTKLFEFDVPEDLFKRFKKADFLKGTITDAISKKPISASIELYDVKTNTLLEKIFSDAQSGEYTAILPNGSQFALYINKEKYFFKSLTFDYTTDNKNAGKQINIQLEPIRTNVIERLNNIFFDLGKADIKPESTTELNKIISLLKANASIKIEIAGHTDDIGSDATNLALSQKRAASVIAFLQQNGIETNRLTAVGYGETKPLMLNNSDENRQINRRIEMKIL
jgi:outer membrane protein OmpA-like peptidoglycan-associated protein